MINDKFIFATGIEGSYPVVQGNRRRDLLEETGHYRFWKRDFDLCKELGVKALRYGIPYHKAHVGPGQYDWSLGDETLPYIRDLGIEVIADLCHFGVPDWIGNFQNTDWPPLFVEYAAAFAKRYPWIRFYTPVNEIHVCAQFSGKEGLWNEQLKSDQAMVRAHINMCRASLLSMEKILEVRPGAVFIQSETAEIFHEQDPKLSEETRFKNELRFLTFDFLYGHEVSGTILAFLLDNGETVENYQGALEYGRRMGPHCIMGIDYYAWNEQVVTKSGGHESVGAAVGWYAIAKQYWERYRKPMMLTETNCMGVGESASWMWTIWHNLQMLRKEGAPVIGYTWYSLQNQVDWDIQLREVKGVENENGLYDLQRNPNPVAAEFKKLCRLYGDEPIVDSFPGSVLGTEPGDDDVEKSSRFASLK